uniref:Uncharacterized protein n=1 Tax=viral metagenome TaxID=1070528 RepID=A0A6C0LEH2_9ZZZZ
MLLYFIISNFIINIIFLGLIIYFLVVLSKKNDNKYTSQSEINLKSSNKNLVSSVIKSNASNASNASNIGNLSENKKESKKVKFVYDQKKCFECIRINQQLGIFGDCPHCGSENYDTGCVPALVQEGKPNNCVPKELTPEQAFLSCKSVSNSQQSCNLIHPKYMLEYQKEECKRPDGDYDYYCAYDESDSCSYNRCNLDDYYSYGPQSICDCQKVPNENLPNGYGRECIKGNNCNEFHPLHKAPELLTDPGLKRFYNGYGTWMDVPRLNTWYSSLMADVQAI